MGEPGLSPDVVRDLTAILKAGVALGLIVLAMIAVQIVARRWLKPAWRWRVGRASQGPCAHCGREVRHGYPWWTGNPKRGGRPLHDECARPYGLVD